MGSPLISYWCRPDYGAVAPVVAVRSEKAARTASGPAVGHYSGMGEENIINY